MDKPTTKRKRAGHLGRCGVARMRFGKHAFTYDASREHIAWLPSNEPAPIQSPATPRDVANVCAQAAIGRADGRQVRQGRNQASGRRRARAAKRVQKLNGRRQV